MPEDLKAAKNDFLEDLNSFVVTWTKAAKKGETVLYTKPETSSYDLIYYSGTSFEDEININDDVKIGDLTINLNSQDMFKNYTKIEYFPHYGGRHPLDAAQANKSQWFYTKAINLPGYLIANQILEVKERSGYIVDAKFCVVGLNLV